MVNMLAPERLNEGSLVEVGSMQGGVDVVNMRYISAFWSGGGRDVRRGTGERMSNRITVYPGRFRRVDS